MDKKMLDDILNQIEDEDADSTGKKGLSLLSDPQDGPKGDGGQDGDHPPNESAAEPDGSSDDDPEVGSDEQTKGPTGGGSNKDDGAAEGGTVKLEELVNGLSEDEKAKLRALLGD